MAIISVNQLRSFEYSESKGSKGSVDLKGSAEFIAKFDGEVDFSLLVNDTSLWPGLGNAMIPRIGDLQVIGGFPFFVSNRKFGYFKGDEQERAARITVEYDNKLEEQDEQKPEDTDADTWKKITVTTEQQSVPLSDEGSDGTLGGVPARNSAGDPVDGLEENRCLVKLTYANSQVQNPDFASLLAYVNTTNDGPFLGCARRTILCQGFNADYDDRKNVWSISVEWLYDPQQHIVKFYDAGFNEIINNERRAILDVRGNPVSKPVPLDNGVAVSPASLMLQPEAYIKTRTAYPYKEKTMSNIFSESGI